MLRLIARDGGELVAEARPAKGKGLPLGAASTLVGLVSALASQRFTGEARAGLGVLAGLLGCLAIWFLALGFTARRARYTLRVNGEADRIEVEDVRGLDPVRRWEGSAEDVGEVGSWISGVWIRWAGEGGSTLWIACPDESARDDALRTLDRWLARRPSP